MSRRTFDLKGIAIDFGGTLAYIDKMGNKEYHEALLSMANEFGYQGNLRNLVSVLNDVIWHSMKGEFKNMQEFWKQFAEKLDMPSSPVLMKNLENVRTRYSSVVFQLCEGALPVLSVLQDRYQLALVSNCAIGTQDVITTLELASYFECIVLSYEVGVRKPHKQMYLEALQCLGLEADECIFVADEISDLEGAKEVGMKTILVRQGSHTFYEARDQNFQPDFQCNNISEITRFL